MKRRVLIIVLVPLTAFVLHSAARIEVLNVRAGNYLPRSDRDPDGTFTDGKWRIAQEDAARDQLRAAVQTFGLLQYVPGAAAINFLARSILQDERIVGQCGCDVQHVCCSRCHIAYALPRVFPEPGLVNRQRAEQALGADSPVSSLYS